MYTAILAVALIDEVIFRDSTGMIPIRQLDSGVSFSVRVHPRAKKNAITGEVGDALKVALTAPPVDGKANQACVEFFAKLLKVARSSVTIASGETSRNKVIHVAELTSAQVRERLSI
jgi:uncharacterized protein (TIGR00251 family)